MTATARATAAVSFSPELTPDDSIAGHWLRQVTVRLRREVLWMQHQRGHGAQGRRGSRSSAWDPTGAALDLVRYSEVKLRFFARDETARFLSAQIAAPEPERSRRPPRGSFAWVDQELRLEPVERFLLALSILTGFDSAAGSVIAAYLNDATATQPTLELAQRLWDEPVELTTVAEAGHRLRRHGLLEPASGRDTVVEWRAPLVAPALVGRQLLFPGLGPPALLRTLALGAEDGRTTRLGSAETDGLGIVPVVGPRGAEHAVAAARAAGARGLDTYEGAPEALAQPGLLDALACNCWLRGVDLLLDLDAAAALLATPPVALPSSALPIRLFLAVEAGASLAQVPQSRRLPAVHVPRLTYETRLDLWRRELGERADSLGPALRDVARRFRFEAGPIRAVCRRLGRDAPLTSEQLVEACRAEFELDLGGLAEEVQPRFGRDELVLPYKQSLQLDEIRRAMASLSEVHYEWGTGRAWDEAGLAVLFAGPPGTGKTMAAEVLARELELPLYRCDLSQIVDKYIGESEKNLRRVFDACESSDLIVLFDEADALFGHRTQVKDAHDRYANLEVSYLLSRMERAKGVTILATNRKEDLDAAFLRRLRYVVDFPLPGAKERRRIWAVAIPDGVDASALDIPFLAERFPLTGGHIRSAVFNACLQSAAGMEAPPRLRMEELLVAVRRELDKAERTISLERFGPYADLMRGLEHGELDP